MSTESTVFYVGTHELVGHHAAPLSDHIPIEIVDHDEVRSKAKPGDLAVFYSEHFDANRESVRLLKEKNCATLYAIDGILEWRNAWENREDEPACPWTMRPCLSHKVACIGASQLRVLNAWGNAEKTELVGLPRLDSLIASQNKIESVEAEREEFRLLIMTAKWPGFTEKQMNNAKRGLSELKRWIEDRDSQLAGKRIVPIWRLTHDLDKQIGVENQLADLSGVEIRDLLPQVDAVITTPSTTILEAMLCGVPVSTLEFNNCPTLVDTAWKITAKDHFDQVIGELVDRPKTKMTWQQNLLQDHLVTERASQRMTQLIQKMLAISADCLANEKGIEFPANMLDPPVGWQHFDHRTLFPNHTEFEAFDTVALQSELAHARREIDHRQRQLDQALSELSQAHEIFAFDRKTSNRWTCYSSKTEANRLVFFTK